MVWIAVLVVAGLLLLAQSATAQTQRPFKEVFGSAAQPSISGATLEVELRSGDILVTSEGSIFRFNADGTPASFSGLGTNVIDGEEENGRSCQEEAASCDRTPRGKLYLGGSAVIAIDESGTATDGNIYVAETGSAERWVDAFAADGTYLGELNGYQEESFASTGQVEGIAVDNSGAVFLATERKIYKYVPTGLVPNNDDGVFAVGSQGNGTLTGLELGAGPTAGSLFSLGNADNNFSVARFSSATGEFEQSFGSEVGSFIAVDPSTGNVLAKSRETILEFEARPNSAPRQVGQIFPKAAPAYAQVNARSELIVSEPFSESDPPRLGVYGTPLTVPTVTIETASGVSGTRAILSGTIDPEEVPVTGCLFEYRLTGSGEFSGKEECENLPPTDSAPHRVQAEIENLQPDGESYEFRLVAEFAKGKEVSNVESLTTAPTVVTQPATTISTSGATLDGLLRPEGESYSACYFEFGLDSTSALDRRAPCTPRADELSEGFSPQLVGAPIAGLQKATTYRYKLVATTPRGTREGEELTFTTQGAPRIGDVRAADADQNSVTLEAKVNPSGFSTSYRFEWGPTSAYGNRVPGEFDPVVGSGEAPVHVSGHISGLTTGTTYHYRIVATSTLGTVASPDHEFETLNTCGLPERRCFELVSRPDAGPVALPGVSEFGVELWFQVDPVGDSIAYPVEFGYPGARKGTEVLYRAALGQSGWESTELSPPHFAPSERTSTGAGSGYVRWLSDDLSCGFVESSQPLTDDPTARRVIEAGGTNIYRRNPDGSYTLVTNLPPDNLDDPGVGLDNVVYSFGGAANDCHKVVFSTQLRYPGVMVSEPATITQTYEWDEGELRALPAGTAERSPHVVSADGSRVFLAQGTLIEDGQAREYAASQTSTPPTNVQYQWSNAAGSRVFFTADAGLTAEASGVGAPEGTDLYEYDLETDQLTDLTVARASGGARVAGFVGASDDGAIVYFASPARLVPGRGPTLEQNELAKTNSIYESDSGQFRYVGVAGRTSGVFGIGNQEHGYSSEVSADGRYLLFQSELGIADYQSGGAIEAYLFDSDGGPAGATICLSCRADGQPSLAAPGYQVLPHNAYASNFFHQPRLLTSRGGRPVVFFSSVDILAPGAVAGQANIYEWTHDQVFRLAGSPAGGFQPPTSTGLSEIAGANADGTDLYLTTPENLTWEDRDGRVSVFDARIGGGFPEPPTPPGPCEPNSEDSCQGPAGSTTVGPSAATTSDSGVGNFRPKKKKRCAKRCGKKKSRHKRHHKNNRHRGNDGGKKNSSRGDDGRKASK